MPTEKEIDLLYDALDTPVASPINRPLGPDATKASKLSENYLKSLKLKFKAVDLNKDKVDELSDNEAPTLKTITALMHVNALSGRPKEAIEAFESISKLGMSPDIVSFNHLMDVHARSMNLTEAVRVFAMIRSAGMSPDLVSYSTLIKASVQAGELNAAFKVYASMRQAGILPNEIVFGTLIKGCLKAREFDRAWKTFDHMRTEITAPNIVTYNLMIHACSRTKDAERAADLFHELADRNLTADQFTYTSLIQAYASRSDYYTEAFVLLEQMAAEGFLPNSRTFHVLLNSAASYGDLTRARLIWNDMVRNLPENASDASADDIQISEYTFSVMFKLYRNALRHIWSDATSDGIDVGDSTIETKDDDSTSSTALEVVETPNNSIFPFLSSTSSTPESIISEAKMLWDLLQTNNPVLEAIKTNKNVQESYLLFLAGIGTPESLNSALKYWREIEAQVQPSLYIYASLIKACANHSSTLSDFEALWKQMLDWDMKQEALLEQPVSSSDESTKEKQLCHLSRSEKEVLRSRQGRGKQEVFQVFRIVARGYAKHNQYDKAVQILRDARMFRHPYYLPSLSFGDIREIVAKAKENADNGKWKLMSDVLDLCPPSSDPLVQVQHKLRSKVLPTSSWWGWRLMGIDTKEKHALVRKNLKKKQKALQRMEALRNRANK